MVSFSVDARNDSSIVKIKSGANRTVDTANLNALVLTYNDGVKIEFDPPHLPSIVKHGQLMNPAN